MTPRKVPMVAAFFIGSPVGLILPAVLVNVAELPAGLALAAAPVVALAAGWAILRSV